MRKNVHRFLILIVASIMLLSTIFCDGDDGDDNYTPLPRDVPDWYTPEPTADYSEW